MKSGLLYIGLLIVLIISCTGVVSAAPSDKYLTVDIGQNAVDLSKYVSGDMIGYWTTPDASGAPSKIITIEDKSAFDITRADFSGCTGIWYNTNSAAMPFDKALNVVDSYLTVNLGQNAVDVSNYVSGDMIGYWGGPNTNGPPSSIIIIDDKSAVDINYVFYPGFWYNINSESGPAVDIALNVVDSYKTVRIGQKNVDVSKYVSGDMIGYWTTPDASGAPSKIITIEDKSAFDITRADFGGCSGIWYNTNSAAMPLDKALNVVDPKA